MNLLPVTAPEAPATAVQPAAQPGEAVAIAFQSALLRAAARRGRGPVGDDEEPPQGDVASPSPAAQPLAAPAPLQAAAEAPTWAPQPVREPDAVTRVLQAAPPPATVESRWQMELLEPGLPVQRLDAQRLPGGALELVLTRAPEAPPALATERLRQRLVARGHDTAAVRQRHSSEQEP